MTRIIILLIFSTVASSPALAIELFHKHWKEYYLTDNPDELFVKQARRAGCYICHVKGQKKRDVQNEYGSALSQYLHADDFPQDWVDANPDEAKRRIIEAFQKVEQEFDSLVP